jgi:hypothetical protein
MSDDKRKRCFNYNNENPIKISNKNNMFNHFYLDELIFCGGENTLYNDIWILEISTNSSNQDITFKNYEKENNRVVGLFNPKFTFSAYNRDEGSVLTFGENRKIEFNSTNEIFLYVKNVNDGSLVDFKDITYLIIYSFNI